MSKSINIEITEAMQNVIEGMPDEIAQIYLTPLLDMACLMVQLGDINIDIIGDKKLKLTAYTKSGVRNLTVDLISDS